MSNFKCEKCGTDIVEGYGGRYVTYCPHYPLDTRPAPADVVADGANVFKRYFALLDKFEEDERLAPLFSATGRDICVEFAQAETATLSAENGKLREALREMIQIFNDLETDCRTAFPKYDSWPMADDVVVKAKAILNNDAKDSPERA